MICGEGVGLRLVLEEDLVLLNRWQEAELADSMFYSLALLSETGLRSWFKTLLGDPNRMRFMVQRVEDGATIGILGLERIDYRNQTAELAGLVIDPAERRRGWGTKAIETLIRYGFNDLNFNRLFARIYRLNQAAHRVVEKAGFQNEGTLREAVFHNWSYEDVVYWSILREEWKHAHATSAAVR